MINHTKISFHDDRLKEIQSILDKLAPHEHADGINECRICDQPLDEAILIELRKLLSVTEAHPKEEYYCPEHKYNPPENSGLALCPQCEFGKKEAPSDNVNAVLQNAREWWILPNGEGCYGGPDIIMPINEGPVPAEAIHVVEVADNELIFMARVESSLNAPSVGAAPESYPQTPVSSAHHEDKDGEQKPMFSCEAPMTEADKDEIKQLFGEPEVGSGEKEAPSATTHVLQNALEEARRAFNEILTIHWGWDGDCGASRLAEDGFDVCDSALKLLLSEHSNAARVRVLFPKPMPLLPYRSPIRR